MKRCAEVVERRRPQQPQCRIEEEAPASRDNVPTPYKRSDPTWRIGLLVLPAIAGLPRQVGRELFNICAP